MCNENQMGVCGYGQSEDITSLAQALLQVQANLKPAVKDANNAYYKTQYATLASVMDTCRSLLAENGIVVIQCPTPAPVSGQQGLFQLSLTTKLIHAQSGQWISSTMVIPLEKYNAQSLGSAITYGRRTALSAMLGIVTADDDGDAASSRSNDRHGSGGNAGKGYHSRQNGNYSNQGAQKRHGNIQDLPSIPNIKFEEKADKDGVIWIVASDMAPGASEAAREQLLELGFKWGDRSQCWWLQAE